MATSFQALRQTPLNAEHHQLGARMVPYAGWEMPVQYVGVVREHKWVRESAGLFDVSHMGRILLTGSAAVSTVDALVANNLSRVAVGGALYTCCCNSDGMILDDLIVYRLAEDKVLVICNASNRTKISSLLLKNSSELCQVQDVSDETALLAVQGPKALHVVERAGITSGLSTRIGRFCVRSEKLGVISSTVARTGYTGEDGVEVMISSADAVACWKLLLAACEEVGGGAVGLAARDTLRLEASLSLYGNELSEEVQPFEAGLGWTVDLKSADFQGKEALIKLGSQSATRCLVGFEMVGRGVARSGYAVLAPSGEEIGDCTSGCPSPTLGRSIGLAYLPPAYAAIGQKLQIDCRGKKIEAQVVKTPFYRRQRSADNSQRK